MKYDNHTLAMIMPCYVPPVLVTGITEATLWSNMSHGTGNSAVRTRATLTLHTRITIIQTNNLLIYVLPTMKWSRKKNDTVKKRESPKNESHDKIEIITITDMVRKHCIYVL